MLHVLLHCNVLPTGLQSTQACERHCTRVAEARNLDLLTPSVYDPCHGD